MLVTETPPLGKVWITPDSRSGGLLVHAANVHAIVAVGGAVLMIAGNADAWGYCGLPTAADIF